jgi:elongation factor Ts
MKISAQQVKQLREATGVSMMACKKALAEAEGDQAKAKHLLRKKGQKVAEKKLIRTTNQGNITSYIHNNGKIGALVEVHCETDFVAKNKDFKKLCGEIALQVVGYDPLYVSPDYIPEEDLKEKEKVFKEELIAQGLKEAILKKALVSKLNKFKEERSLLSQPYFRNDKKTVNDIIQEAIAKLGENIQVQRFTRYQI